VNHSSRVILRDDAPRAVRVESGEALLEAAHREDLPALRLDLPAGEVEVTGTRVELYATPTLSVVGVLDGTVNAKSAGKTRAVGAGAEALLVPGLAPVLKPAANLAASVAWAEDRDESALGDPSGLGSLRARKPGAKNDTEEALRLTDHRVDVRIQGAVARTTIEEAFKNESADTLEGTYTFPLPQGARIAALELLVDGTWERGAIVERKRGEKIWRGVIRQATPKKKRVTKEEWIWVPGPWRDPALLQWKQGNQFSLRIFPIPARGERRVRIAYTETLQAAPGGRRYVLPLAADAAGKARADRFRFEARVGGLSPKANVRATPYPLEATRADGSLVLTTSLENFAPVGDIVLDVPDEAPTDELRTTTYREAEQEEAFALFALQPPLPPRGSDAPVDLVVIVDRSYSTQALRLGRAAEFTAGVVRGLGEESRVQVLACGTSCAALGEGFRAATPELADALAGEISELEALGSTRLEEAVAAAGRALRAGGGPVTRGRVLYLGDGIASLGELDPSHLAARTREALGAARLTAVSLGGEVDDVVLRAMTRATDGAFIPMRPGDSVGAAVWKTVDRQFAEPLRDARLALPEGVREVAPAELGVVWPGDELFVTARMGGPVSGAVILSGRVAGDPYESRFTVNLRPEGAAGNAFLPRMWAERRIDDLEQTDSEGQRDAIVALSTRFHVLSRHTSLLVLESEAMARAFGVEATRPDVEWTGDEAAESASSEDENAPRLAAESEAKGMKSEALGAAEPTIQASIKAAGGASGSGGGLKDLAEASRGARVQPTPKPGAPRPPEGGHFVRVVRKAVREATFARPREARERDFAELAKREAALAERPDSRERTEALLRWQIRLGQLDAAEALGRAWLDKDRLDAGALLAMADVATVRGDFARALQWLESAVDLDPSSAEVHGRLEAAWRALGDSDTACAHAMSLALVQAEDEERQVAAIRCGGSRERHLAGLSERDRRNAERALEQREGKARVGGSLVATVSWDEGDPVEVVIITPKGRVLSRLGGENKLLAGGDDAERERSVGTPLWELGRYRVRVVHAVDALRKTNGNVRLVAYGQRETRRFETDGGEDDIADLDVKIRWETRRVTSPVPPDQPRPRPIIGR
ncbi:MAG: VIT domain-containing protein, partial [Myxococcota bacterium]